MSLEATIERAPAEEKDLEVQVEVHDRQQLEIRFVYRMGVLAECDFDTDIYLFIPKNVGLSSANYPKQDFYNDVTALMRLDAAALPLELLADPRCVASPLHRLEAAAVDLQKPGDRPPPSTSLATFARLFAHLQAEGARKELKHLREMLRPETAKNYPEEYLAEVDRSLNRVRASLLAFRRCAARLRPFQLVAHRTLIDSLRLADEYMSLGLEERLAGLGALILEEASQYDGSGFAFRVRQKLAALAREEARHRRKWDLLCLDGSEEALPEYFIYRASMLKKVVQQALYLDTRKAQGDTFIRNGVGAAGAAVAAIWALATQLPATVANLPINAKLTFFALAVVAYVTKDRIKALTNEYLVPKLRSFDFVSRIRSSALTAIGLGMLDTRLKEAMRFLRYDEVPEPIRQLRTERRTVRAFEGPLNEEVIHYRKRLEVEEVEAEERLPEGYGIRDIVRFNVRHFLVRLDDPSDKMRYFDSDRDAFREAKVPKVYHLNLVIQVRRTADGKETVEHFDHWRIVINKEGIVRVEDVGK